jgi:hypothetical protein
LTITRSRYLPPNNPRFSKKETPSGCDHKGKYINQAGGIRFWVCPKCKKDLGDA